MAAVIGRDRFFERGCFLALSSQILAEVVATLKQAGHDDAGRELRRATRIEVRSRIVVWPIVDGRSGEAVSVYARDISARGIGLLQSGAQAMRGRFVVGLPRGRREPVLVSCRSLHTRELADRLHFVGAEFEQVLPKNQLAD